MVDGTHMFGKYKGVLLSASGQDADCRIFPISFAVVDNENSDSWKWFFERLSTIVEDSCELTIISDRCAAILQLKIDSIHLHTMVFVMYTLSVTWAIRIKDCSKSRWWAEQQKLSKFRNFKRSMTL